MGIAPGVGAEPVEHSAEGNIRVRVGRERPPAVEHVARLFVAELRRILPSGVGGDELWLRLGGDVVRRVREPVGDVGGNADDDEQDGADHGESERELLAQRDPHEPLAQAPQLQCEWMGGH